MDIKKEREQFLYELKGHGYEFRNTDWHNDWERFEDEQVNMVWELWLAAKQQAVPDGFVVVPVDPTERMLDCAYSSISDNLHYADLENIYRAMTQEFIND